MTHFLDPNIAEIVGVNAAILFYNLRHWVAKNAANEKHFYDGKYWTYNSVQAFEKLFSYMSKKQIRVALEKLKESDLIETGNFNEVKYDRTLWYAITKKGLSLCPIRQIDLPKRENEFAQEGEPIPDNKPNSKPDIYSRADATVSKEIVDYLNLVANKNFRYQSSSCRRHISARLAEGYTVADFKRVIDNKSSEWFSTDMEKYLRPETLFGTKFDSYLNSCSQTSVGKPDGSAGYQL